MSVKANYFKVGIFVLISAGLLVGAIVSFAIPKLEHPVHIETYMDESVSGLSVGSQILYRGVKIGRVENIMFAQNRYNTNARYGRYVVLDMIIEGEKLFGREIFSNIDERLDNLIKAGLRIRITSNPLTGLSSLEADYPTGAGEPLVYDWEPEYHYVPSDMSVLNKFGQSAQAAFEAMEKIDIVGLTKQLDILLERLDKTVADANIKDLSERTEELLVELTLTAKRITETLSTDEGQPKVDIQAVLVRTDRLLSKIEKLTDSQRPNIEKLIEDLRQSSENIKELSAELKDNPNKLLTKPAKSEVIQ